MSTLLRQHKSLGRVLEYLLKSGKHTSRNFRTSSAEGFAQVKSKRVQQSQSAPRWEPTNPAAFWERTQPHVDSKVNSNLRMSWPGVALRVAGVLGIGLYSAWRCPGLVSPAGWGQELRGMLFGPLSRVSNNEGVPRILHYFETSSGNHTCCHIAFYLKPSGSSFFCNCSNDYAWSLRRWHVSCR